MGSFVVGLPIELAGLTPAGTLDSGAGTADSLVDCGDTPGTGELSVGTVDTGDVDVDVGAGWETGTELGVGVKLGFGVGFGVGLGVGFGVNFGVDVDFCVGASALRPPG